MKIETIITDRERMKNVFSRIPASGVQDTPLDDYLLSMTDLILLLPQNDPRIIPMLHSYGRYDYIKEIFDAPTLKDAHALLENGVIDKNEVLKWIKNQIIEGSEIFNAISNGYPDLYNDLQTHKIPNQKVAK